MERTLYVMIPKSARGKGPSLRVISASPCPMRMPAPCGTLWANRQTCEQARTHNDSLREDFQTAEVVLTLKEDFDALRARVTYLERRLRDAGVDFEE